MYLSYTSKLYNTVIVKYYGNHVNLFLYFFYILFGILLYRQFQIILLGTGQHSEMLGHEILRLSGKPSSLSISDRIISPLNTSVNCSSQNNLNLPFTIATQIKKTRHIPGP